ncbi:MAG: oxygen-dependent coproporphyrinogen oxidase [Cytophagaceae bacterium]
MLSKEIIESRFKEVQQHICQALEKADGKATFHTDAWTRPGGGGGMSKVIKDGNVIAKGGVNFSAVYGDTPENIIKALNIPPSDFYATGVSIVIHPINPWVPIIHMNIRYFEMSNGIWWFGGGIDLTPHYIIEEQAVHVHQQLKKVSDRYHTDFYPKFKKWADDYFYIPHREETRGVGGIFFDRMGKDAPIEKEQLFNYACDLGYLFAEVYPQLIEWNKDKSYGEEELYWQRIRRGRYVEFNLVYDKGTKFGLDTNGRTESILMSLPPLASWEYNIDLKEGSKEWNTIQLLKAKPEWLK